MSKSKLVEPAIPTTKTVAPKDANLLYAFWKHDQFPYVLGDQGRFLPDGTFKTHGYGGMVVTRKSLVAVYPLELGQKITATLKEIKEKRRQEEDKILQSYLAMAKSVLPELVFHT